ncbi:MAG TPA: hypothetical protein VKP64_00710 [Mycobacteriales bacterium]|nr:hypothetical protein [Mycobacteriales bacterium]
MTDHVSKYCDCHPSNSRGPKRTDDRLALPKAQLSHREIHELLDELVAEGQLVRRFVDGRWRYFINKEKQS